jgi:hypothetical protein
MDNKFTELLKSWLDTHEDERDYSVGALYLLKLTGNQIMYRNLVVNINARKEFITYELTKRYNFRLAQLTHEQVEAMAQEAETIAADHNLEATAEEPDADEQQLHIGKREDHDNLPDEIKALYVENLSLLQRMREVHLRLRTLSLGTAICPDSDRYPFLKELIELDKKYHTNWDTYDHYVVESEPAAE